MNISEREKEFIFRTYNRLPLEIIRGEGVYLLSKDGNRYLDMFGGLGVNALGYGHRRILNAIKEQSEKYIHLSNYFTQETQIGLAELLVKYSGYSKVFFTNSGTESVEGAIKIVRKWGFNKSKKNIISFTNSFHGRTMGSLSLMDRANYKEGFGPFLEDIRLIKYNDLNDLRGSVDQYTLAVILEFIQGEGGIHEASDEFVSEIRELKQKFRFLLVADEIQSGVGRTGKLFSFQHCAITPDLIVIAKPLGGGLPLGAIIGNEIVGNILQPGNHGTTFGGNPVACAAGIEVIHEIVENGVMDNARNVGAYFKSRMMELKNEFSSLIRDVRGKGLMLGMELSCEGDSVVTNMRERGVLINCTDRNVLRFLPPLVIKEEHVNRTISELEKVFRESSK